ncbi:glycosyltransferase [Kocuria sp. NPDC057446]|uniref:glycosyltransferase n=1 Tax=Kocuria sp. NPDC057446 TaxID=3346137 RepID=UPI003687FE9D
MHPTVLHLDHTRTPGGAEIALRRLCENAGHWVPVLALPAKSKGLETEDAFRDQSLSHVKVIEIGKLQKSGASSASFAQALKFGFNIAAEAVRLRANQAFRSADVIHANTSRAALYGAMACFGTDKPLVVHLRDMVDSASLGRAGKFLFRKFVLPRADAVIGNSKATLSTALPYLKSNATAEVIPSPAGIDRRLTTSFVAPEVRNVGMVARIDPWKGQELLFTAFARVFKDSAAKLYIAGAPAFGHENYLGHLKQRARTLGIEDQVVFMGHIENIFDFLSGMDICVHSSIRPEPLGQNVLQYLAAGRPTVAVNAGGPPEWVTDRKNGLLVQMGSENDLVDALSALNNDFELRKALSEGALGLRKIPTDAEIANRFGSLILSVRRAVIEAKA